MSATGFEKAPTDLGASFEVLFDSMPQLGSTSRADGYCDFFNRAWYEYTGTTFEQMQGEGWKAVHDPDTLPLVVEHWQNSLRTGEPFEMEHRLRRHDGALRWFHTKCTPIRDAGGTIVRWVGINSDVHERILATRGTDELYGSILQNMAEGVCLVRASDRVIVYTNTKLEVMLGYSRGELLGKPVTLVHHPLAATLVTDFEGGIAKQLAEKNVATFDVPNARKDGSLVWCRVHLSPLEHPVFGPVFITLNEDVTEMREVEAERDGFFETSLDMLCIATFDGYYKRLNPAWEQTLGWSRQELMSRPYVSFVHPDDVSKTDGATENLSGGRTLLEFANRYICRDGSYRWLQWKAMPAVEQGVIYAAARDVTTERTAMQSLEEMSESLGTTLDSIADGVIATDVQGDIVRMNPIAERLTGWSLAEAIGRPIEALLQIVHEDTGAIVDNPVRSALRTGSPVTLENRTLLRRRDGTALPIADSCAPIRAKNGHVHGAVLVFRDLTEGRAAEAVQSKLQKQLVFADRMASVGTLAAGMAHEINNPLTYVGANVDAAVEEVRQLSGGSSSGRMRDLEDMLLDAREGVARVSKIVRSLKTFSRIEEQRIGVIDLAPVVELSINMAWNEIRHRARLVKDFGKVPRIDGDDARLGQVFINLIVNAAQAFPEGAMEGNQIHVVLSTDADGRAVVEVRDNGPGMAPDLLTRIFDPFFTTKAVGVGTGLGLAISHNIVTSMGGEIAVHSELGEGTTFRVSLPASVASTAAPAGPSDVASAAPARRARVLLVDDEPSIGMAVRRLLRQHDVTLVTSGAEALALLRTDEAFDVMLSDLMMPGMSGAELYRVLLREFPSIASRVVFATGGAFTPDAAAFLDEVDNIRIEKPFDAKKLRELIAEFVK